MLSELVFESRKPMGFDVCQQSDEIKHVWFFRHAYIVPYPMGGGGFCHFIATVMGTLCIFGQKNGQVGGGVQSSSNFSASVAITFKSLQCVLGCTESNISQKKQTSLSQVPWWPEQQGYLQVHRISHWLSWCDSGIRGWLTVAFFERTGFFSHQKSESAMLQINLLLLSDFVFRNWEIATKMVPKILLMLPIFLAKNTQCVPLTVSFSWICLVDAKK